MHGVMLLVALSAVTEGPGRRPDVVLRWNEVVLDCIRAEKTPPPEAARRLAMVHGAAYDAVNAIYQTHSSFYSDLRATEPADPTTAAAIAAHRVLAELYPRRVEHFDRALDQSLEGVPEGASRDRAVRLGQYAAEKVLAWRAKDGSRRKVAYTPSTEVGVWRPTPPGFKPALLPQWPSVRPFGIRDRTAFRPDPAPPLTSADYTRDLNEVKSLGSRDSTTRTAEQTIIAWFWDDGPGTATPPGHWNLIAQVVARRQGNTLPENARLFALLNVSLADAGIVCWDSKYHYKVWRPVTAIRNADRDGNPDTRADPGWNSLLDTPPFPSYTSGHSTFSGAAARALADFFGTDAIGFTVGSDGLPGTERTFASFSEAAREAGRSRVYGGIHYEFDNRVGLALGRAVAEEVGRTRMSPADSPARTTRSPSPPLRGGGFGVRGFFVYPESAHERAPRTADPARPLPVQRG